MHDGLLGFVFSRSPELGGGAGRAEGKGWASKGFLLSSDLSDGRLEAPWRSFSVLFSPLWCVLLMYVSHVWTGGFPRPGHTYHVLS